MKVNFNIIISLVLALVELSVLTNIVHDSEMEEVNGLVVGKRSNPDLIIRSIPLKHNLAWLTQRSGSNIQSARIAAYDVMYKDSNIGSQPRDQINPGWAIDMERPREVKRASFYAGGSEFYVFVLIEKPDIGHINFSQHCSYVRKTKSDTTETSVDCDKDGRYFAIVAKRKVKSRFILRHVKIFAYYGKEISLDTIEIINSESSAARHPNCRLGSEPIPIGYTMYAFNVPIWFVDLKALYKVIVIVTIDYLQNGFEKMYAFNFVHKPKLPSYHGNFNFQQYCAYYKGVTNRYHEKLVEFRCNMGRYFVLASKEYYIDFYFCPRIYKDLLVNGNWSEWIQWTACSKTCEIGKQIRTRNCTNPAPQHLGKDCVGENNESRPCKLTECPINGNWSEWIQWTACSKTCGIGIKNRTRKCTNPAPQHLGKNCVGKINESRPCNSTVCPKSDMSPEEIFLGRILAMIGAFLFLVCFVAIALFFIIRYCEDEDEWIEGSSSEDTSVLYDNSNSMSRSRNLPEGSL